tara:strand:- start:170 stop:502 length:333 start_codon:yes stop_codon:yes gene_type:complete
MQFNRNTVTLSVGQYASPIFESLNRMKPEHMSFSLFLAVVADDYVKKHRTSARITDFDHIDVTAELPLFYANILKWEKHLNSLKPDGFKKLQKRFSQLNNLINKETEKRL